MAKEIIFYQKENGEYPVRIFLDSLPRKDFQKVIWVLKLISELDSTPKTYFKKLNTSKDIWECHIKHASNIYRLLCFLDGNRIIVLTNAFTKKSQKTPTTEIEKAIDYKKDYLRRKKK